MRKNFNVIFLIQNKLKPLIFWCLLLMTLQIYSQPNDTIAKLAGFEYHIIQVKKGNKVTDSIRFIISEAKDKSPKPVIVFVQGSGNDPLLIYNKDNNWAVSWLPPFKIDSFKNKYRFVIISKPGIPLYQEWTEEPPVFYDTSLSGFDVFERNDYLNYYVNSTILVMKYLKKQKIATKIYAIGHSSGAHVVSLLSASPKTLLTKAVYLSSDIFSRRIEEITAIRRKAASGSISEEEAQAKVDSIYQQIKNYKYTYDCYLRAGDTLNSNFYQIRNHYSYNYAPAYKNLLQTKIPIMVCYGTNDIKSMDIDLLPILCLQEGQGNITVKAYAGWDHSFMVFEYDKNGQVDKKENHFDEVFEDIEKWLHE